MPLKIYLGMPFDTFFFPTERWGSGLIEGALDNCMGVPGSTIHHESTPFPLIVTGGRFWGVNLWYPPLKQMASLLRVSSVFRLKLRGSR